MNSAVKYEPKVKFDKKISKEEKERMEQPITLQEISLALKETPNNKAPGPDDITADWLKVFWGKIKNNYLSLINHTFKVGRILTSGRYSVITLIPKLGCDNKLLKNWRPICLLGVGYKLLSKTIANRLKQVLPNIIHLDQSGFVAGCNIRDSLRKTLDTIEIAKIKQIDALLLCIDFEKAFDMVKYNSLFAVLKSLGIGENMIRWMRILFYRY